ncbi:MAG: DUF948 domain-containing protein [Candidatus Sericytochromatia bacterium]
MITSMWHILALVLAIGSAFLIYYIITVIIQLRSTVKVLESTISSLKSDIVPVINNVEGITGNFEHITNRADDIFKDVQDKTKETMSLVDYTKTKVSNFQNILKYTFYLYIRKANNSNNIVYNKESKEILKVVNAVKIVDHLEIMSK